jgi:NADH:ubiquinone oxidoreductase subunit 6 (subunit J)
MGPVIVLYILGVMVALLLIVNFWSDILAFLKWWIIKPYRLIIFIIILIGLITLFLYGNRNAGKSTNTTKTNYKNCAMCGDRVPEDDMRGNWCKDCQKDAFGEDGWYDKIKD